MPETSSTPVGAAHRSRTAAGPTIQLSTTGGLLLVLFLSVFAVAPLFYPGGLQTHSGFVPFWNLSDLRANVGNFGWTPHIFTTFDPLRSDGLLPHYLAALLPLPPVAALKLVAGLGWLLGGAGMFLWLKSWLGNPGAALAALVYVYLPHQIAAALVRGAWAETVFWGVLPWAILAATFLVTSPRVALLPVAAAFWLALGLTQLGLALWALALLAALLLVVHLRQSLLPLLSAALGVALAAGVNWLIAGTLTGPPPVSAAEHLLYPFQLFSAKWGFGASVPGWGDDLSLQVGLAALGLSIFTVAVWQRSPTVEPSPAARRDRRLRFFLAAGLVLALLQLTVAAPLWNWPPAAATVTWPWQLMGFAGLCLSVVAGALLWVSPQMSRPPLFAGLLLLVLLSAYPTLLPQFLPPDPAMNTLPRAELDNGRLALLDYRLQSQTPTEIEISESDEETSDSSSAGKPLPPFTGLAPGQTLLLHVRWQPLAVFDRDLKVFVHLVGADDAVLAQFDGPPQDGEYPTSRWIPGEIIADIYPLALPADAPPGPYRLFLGLYDESTLARLPVTGDSQGRVILEVK